MIGNNSPEFHNGLFQTDFKKWLFGTLFLDSRFQNHPDSVILQTYQSLLNQSFKPNSAHVPPLNLTPMLSLESWFCISIINDYYTKSKGLGVRPFSPWTTVPRTYPPMKSPPVQFLPRSFAPPTTPLDNYNWLVFPWAIAPHEIPPGQLPPTLLPPGHFPLNNSPLNN